MFTDKEKANILEAGFQPSKTEEGAYWVEGTDSRGDARMKVIKPIEDLDGWVRVESYFNGGLHERSSLRTDANLFRDLVFTVDLP